VNINITHFRILMNNLKDNTNKCTSNKMCTFTYNQLRLQHVSVFFISSSGRWHQTSIYETQTNYQRD